MCLSYPSALIVEANDKALIEIAEECTVEGTVLLTDNNCKGGVILLSTGSTVYGQVISESKIEHYGVVNGQVVCKSLVITDRAGEHINYLRNGTVNRDLLPEQYLFAGIFEGETSHPKVLINY